MFFFRVVVSILLDHFLRTSLAFSPFPFLPSAFLPFFGDLGFEFVFLGNAESNLLKKPE